MTKVLPADDLKRNMYIAVLDYWFRTPFGDVRDERAEAESMDRDTPPPGLPLRVVDVSLPFVGVETVLPRADVRRLMVLDVRRLRLGRLSGRYVRRLLGAVAAHRDEADRTTRLLSRDQRDVEKREAGPKGSDRAA